MIILSLDVRQVGGTPKRISLSRMFNLYNLNITLLQETMVEGTSVQFSCPLFFLGGSYARSMQLAYMVVYVQPELIHCRYYHNPFSYRYYVRREYQVLG
jgi:hypothetical protein